MKEENKIRLNKAIAMSGFCSRRKADTLIARGMVKVNGSVVFNLATKVTSSDKIYVQNKSLNLKKPTRYVLFNKPPGYITTSNDELTRKTIYDLLPAHFRKLKTAGRLDRDSEGLLILSDDGDFLNKIIHPKYKIKKTYIAELSVNLSKEETDFIKSKFISGICLDGKTVRADNLREIKLNSTCKGKHTKFEIVIHEGFNRQIRRMFQTVGYSVAHLKRIKIGPFELGAMQRGSYLELQKDNLYEILNS